MIQDKEMLKEAIQSIEIKPVAGDHYYRAIKPRYLSTPLSGEGAARAGGRYNKKGSHVTYLAENHASALLEIKAIIELRSGFFAEPREGSIAILCVKVSLTRVLDLTDVDNMKILHTNMQELTGDFSYLANLGAAPTQVIGTIAEELNYEAILYPSKYVQPNDFYNSLAIFGNIIDYSSSPLPLDIADINEFNNA